MNIRNVAILALAAMLPFGVQAQKKKRSDRQPVVAPAENPRITAMRQLTQQVVFIDSAVISKDEFLKIVRLSPETGSIISYDKFFRSQGHTDCFVFLNEMANKCYFSNTDDSGRLQLYTADKLGNEWTSPAMLEGLDDGISETNYPFMMSDGTTLYFAGRGEESIGGYDIFFTRYDADNNRFLKPENLGMPFNSEANDYMYAVDEFSQIGYFVTDRRQQEGNVCVYIFIPPTTRRTYESLNYTIEQITPLAKIQKIADTWGDGKERNEALKRLKTLFTASAAEKAETPFQFVVNDVVTYNNVSQFKSVDGKALIAEYLNARKKLEESALSLEKSRRYYAKARPDDRAILARDIIASEGQYERLAAEIKSLEKRIRNAENQELNNK
jgi:hypothetical protein